MTAEIALLNRSAVALAADSAVTITYWRDGKPHTRYSKSANKIFHISKSRPVGLMIYQAANLQGMPWEVLIKAYRESRGDGKFSVIEDYADDLFDFIIKDDQLFPVENQNKQLATNIGLSANKISVRCRIEKSENDLSLEEKTRLVASRLSEVGRELDGVSYIDSIDFDEIVKEVEVHKDQIIREFNGYPAIEKIADIVDVDDLYRISVKATFKKESAALSDTGLVFAGFGESEYFPRIIGYRCYGVLLGKLIYDKLNDQDVNISHENVSDIRPIATSHMVNTFIHGASLAALSHMDKMFKEKTAEFVDNILSHLQCDASADEIEAFKAEALEKFSEEMLKHLWAEHTHPLRRVIGMLSISELAELAETLIFVESLKERVTSQTESVSGPIDVAVISKTDGLIWIKRKLYFDATLNPRYLTRAR